MVDLPKEVHVITKKATGKKYYYWVPNRGTKNEGKRIPLPSDPASAAFWAKVEALGGSNPMAPAGSVANLVRRYRESEDFKKNTDSTRETYEVHMRRFEDLEAWGRYPAEDLSPLGVQTARDAMRETPYMANQMLAVGKTIWAWAIPLGLLGNRPINPFDHVSDLDTPDRGHVPWPEWAQAFVLEHAPADLVRFVKLGAWTGQRESDLVLFGPEHRENNGLWCRPKKTRKKRRAFFIPLAAAEALELDRWAETPIRFENSRWKAPIERFREDLYLYTPRAEPYTPDRIRARWGRWLASKQGKELCRRWKEWLVVQVKRYGWEIDPEDVRGPTLHGLRGTAVLTRRRAGYTAQAIANDIGMSLPMVERYTRFIDQMDVAEANRRRFEIVEGGR
ncbi:hypothetical protein AA309_19925 [Microvirga vignae]|uniref:Tyr recombinase domain-containing protein n=1 Tax=Microvirga vignae TaxID=1225564 RepID=A0A0H1RFL0_9HYPH|nr:hypothetical protein [Microvirga vignae]KLK91372.1 hypothetical protein AA309_19925 [Microvirga vignae]